jgi:hypothetical protein
VHTHPLSHAPGRGLRDAGGGDVVGGRAGCFQRRCGVVLRLLQPPQGPATAVGQGRCALARKRPRLPPASLCAGTRPHLRMDFRRGAGRLGCMHSGGQSRARPPGTLAHIRAGTCSHLRRDLPTSAPGLTHICAGSCLLSTTLCCSALSRCCGKRRPCPSTAAMPVFGSAGFDGRARRWRCTSAASVLRRLVIGPWSVALSLSWEFESPCPVARAAPPAPTAAWGWGWRDVPRPASARWLPLAVWATGPPPASATVTVTLPLAGCPGFAGKVIRPRQLATTGLILTSFT